MPRTWGAPGHERGAVVGGAAAVEFGNQHALDPETVAQATRRGLRAIVARTALPEEAQLLVGSLSLAAGGAQSLTQALVTLLGHFGQLATGHSVQHSHRRTKSLGNTGRLEIGEGPERVNAEAPTRRRQIFATQHRE